MWILFFFITIGGNPAATSAEFNSKEACMTAGQWMTEQNTRTFGHAWYHCVEKGKAS